MTSIQEIASIKEQIIPKYSPNKIILFGSQCNGTATKKSDIDLCIVKNTENKRALAADMYLNIESEKPRPRKDLFPLKCDSLPISLGYV